MAETTEVPGPTWNTVEQEDVEQEGWIVIPSAGKPNQYAMKGPASLFTSKDEAERVVMMMISKGVAGIGDVKIAQARLSHHRKVDIAAEDTTPKLVLVGG